MLRSVKKIVGLGLFVCLNWLKKARAIPSNVNSILVVRRNKIGDAIAVILVLRELKLRYPQLKITMLVETYTAALYKEFLPSAEIIEFPDKKIGNFFFLLRYPVIRQLKSRVFDIGINASASFSSKAILTLNFFKVRYRIAVGKPEKKFWSLFLDSSEPIPEMLDRQHQVLKILSIFKRSGMQMFVPRLDSVYPSHHQKFLLFPESNRKQSIWPIEYWILLRDALVAKGFVVEFCGSEKLAMQVPSVITPSDTQALIATIKQYDSVICAEGGASHLAAICQKQVTVISGVAIKDTWFPWSLDVALIERSGGVETIVVDEVLQVALRQGEFNRLSISFDENLPEKMNAYLNQETV